MFRMPPPHTHIIFSVCGPIATKFFLHGLAIKELAQIWKKMDKINDVIDNDVIIVRKLAEKTVESDASSYEK